MMKKLFERMELEIIKFRNEDIIVTSPIRWLCKYTHLLENGIFALTPSVSEVLLKSVIVTTNSPPAN